MEQNRVMEVLGERDTWVLKTVVAQYIVTGEPVGSRTVAKTSGLNLSPATIRNLMLDLEERGFLSQPHTSAGRDPHSPGFAVLCGPDPAHPVLGPVHAAADPGGLRTSRPTSPKSYSARPPGCSPW